MVDRKVLLRRVSYLECIADKQAEEVAKGNKADSQQAGKETDKVNTKVVSSPKEQTQVDLQQSTKTEYVPAEYTRTLDKAYRFFKDGHVQQIQVSSNAQYTWLHFYISDSVAIHAKGSNLSCSYCDH